MERAQSAATKNTNLELSKRKGPVTQIANHSAGEEQTEETKKNCTSDLGKSK
jgi:hypothetical protein